MMFAPEYARTYRKYILTGEERLLSVYRWSRQRGATPEDSAQLLVCELGRDAAAELLSCLVLLRGSWDVRISRDSRAWAAAVCSYDVAELDNIPGLHYPDEIHPAHMEQIVRAFRAVFPV